MLSTFADIVCGADGGTMAWEVIYISLEDEWHKITITKVKMDSLKPSGVKFKDVSCSFLQKIGERAKILPYTDIIRWVVEKLSIEDRQFRKSKRYLMRSFKVEDLKQIYHLPDPRDIYEKSFLDKFTK